MHSKISRRGQWCHRFILHQTNGSPVACTHTYTDGQACRGSTCASASIHSCCRTQHARAWQLLTPTLHTVPQASPGRRQGCLQLPAHGSACCQSGPACQLAGGLLPVPATTHAHMHTPVNVQQAAADGARFQRACMHACIVCPMSLDGVGQLLVSVASRLIQQHQA